MGSALLIIHLTAVAFLIFYPLVGNTRSKPQKREEEVSYDPSKDPLYPKNYRHPCDTK